ncbi:MAG: pilus assembly protein PilM [Planctomycetota bacterium]|jgi:type IV pilus assembly protein PilM
MLWNRNRAVGVDIGEGSVKAVEAERSGNKLRVLRAAVRSLPPNLSPRDPEGMAAFLRDFFADVGFKSDRVYIGLPRHQAILRTLRLPSAEEAETQQMIRFQSRKVLPMNGEGLKMGYLLREGEGDRSALVVAAKEDVFEGYVKAAVGAGLKVQGVTLSSFGAANAYLNGFPDGTPGVVVDIGSQMTEITLSAYGKFASSRQASVGVEGLIRAMGEESGLSRGASSQAIRAVKLGAGAAPGASEWAASIASEVDRTLRAFATEGLPAPERVLLTGGGSQVGGLNTNLSEQIGVPVEMFPQGGGIEGWPTDAPANPGAIFLQSVGYLLGGFIGLGTQFDFGANFFAMADYKAKPTKKYLLAATAVAVLLAAWLVPNQQFGRMEKELDSKQKMLEKREKTEGEDVTALQKKLKDLRSWTWKRANWVDVLREITLAVPETKDVYLTQVQFREGGEPVKIHGRAIHEDAVNNFVKALTRSSMIRQVERRSIQQHRDRKEKHRWDFEITGFLTEPTEEVSR